MVKPRPVTSNDSRQPAKDLPLTRFPLAFDELQKEHAHAIPRRAHRQTNSGGRLAFSVASEYQCEPMSEWARRLGGHDRCSASGTYVTPSAAASASARLRRTGPSSVSTTTASTPAERSCCA